MKSQDTSFSFCSIPSNAFKLARVCDNTSSNISPTLTSSAINAATFAQRVASLPVPVIQKLDDPLLRAREVEVSVMRLDLLDVIGSGNKFFKLLRHLEIIQALQPDYVLSFGGAYSNHLHALAFSCRELDVQHIAMVHHDETFGLTPTLADIQTWGTRIHYLNRSDYRRRYDCDFLAQLKLQYPNAYIIAEGAADSVGIEGATVLGFYIAKHLASYCATQQLQCQNVALACGTASSLCGVIAGLAMYQTFEKNTTTKQILSDTQVLGVPILQTRNLQQQLRQGLNVISATHLKLPLWCLEGGAHYGGYAKLNPQLYTLAQRMLEQQLPLDPIYTVKLLYHLFAMIENKTLAAGTHIVAVHTGGLQGCRGVADWPVRYALNKLSSI